MSTPGPNLPIEPALPQPRRRLLRTLLRWPRNLSRLAPSIPVGALLSPRPPDQEASPWGQFGLLEDFVTALHRDGTPTYRRRWVMLLHGVKEIERWERFEYRFDRRSWKFTIARARMILPSGEERRATITNRPRDHRGYLRVLKVTFAQLAPGVVVDFEDQQDNFTPFVDCPGIWGDYALQTAYPCRQRRISFAVARPFVARFESHNGAPAPAERQVGDYRVWTWHLQGIAGIESDQATPPLYDFAPWIDFTTLPSWQPVVRYYLKELNMPAAHDFKGLLTRLSRQRPGMQDKLAAAYNYAARDVRSSRPKDQTEERTIRPLGAVTEELRGDCKDKSALLVSLLAHCDVDARVALVRTAHAGRAALLPGAHFNHALVFAKVNGKDLWLDPAAGPYSLGQLPTYDQGVQALILDRHQRHLTSISAGKPADHGVERVVRACLESDGSYRANVRLLARGDRAAAWRAGLIERNASARERLLRQSVGGSFPSAEITDLSVENLDDLDGDLVISYAAVIRALARRIQNLMLLRIPWLEPIIDNGFFAAPSRPQPLLVPVHSISDCHDIQLPFGLSGYGLPLELLEQCDWGRYQCRIRIDNGALRGERDFELRGGIVPPERYKDVRRFTYGCIEGDASDIVLMEANSTEK